MTLLRGYVSGDQKEVREHEVGLPEKDHHGLKNSSLKALNEESLQCVTDKAGT